MYSQNAGRALYILNDITPNNPIKHHKKKRNYIDHAKWPLNFLRHERLKACAESEINFFWQALTGDQNFFSVAK